jgi:hypothetical protein
MYNSQFLCILPNLAFLSKLQQMSITPRVRGVDYGRLHLLGMSSSHTNRLKERLSHIEVLAAILATVLTNLMQRSLCLARIA